MLQHRQLELIRSGCPAHLLDFYSCPQGSKGKAPPAPDYAGAAIEQGKANKAAVTQQTWANRPDQFTPWGSVNWKSSSQVDPATGQPVTKWTQQEQLRPELEQALGSQVGLQTGRSELASGMLGRVADEYSQPFNWDNLPTAPEFAEERQRYTDAAFEQMRPEHQRQQESVRTRLANQGITQGSQAYDTELERLGGVQANERWNAVNQGGIEQQRMNQLLLSGRQQAISEQSQQRGRSLNELNALLTGQQVQAPNMPSFTSAQGYQPGNFQQAAGQAGAYNMQAQQMANDANAGLWGGVGQAAGTGALLYALGAFSDERLKENVERVGTHPLGIGIYEYDLFGHRERGVMAQEVLEVAPELVSVSPSGYLTVDYGRL